MQVFLFPGQGSQQKGMGADFFDEFGDLTREADEILGYSIKELCLEDPGGQLIKTQFTQPAVYVVNALCCLKKIQEEGRPSYILGHSVGEYNALLVSGVIDFATGLKLVKKRGELMARVHDGGMAAVMGLTGDRIEEIIRENNFKTLFIANYNSPHQVVISGLKEDIEKAEPLFFDSGATHYKILNVSGAFHTPYMEKAKKKFKKYVRKFEFSDIGIPVISNVTARPYRREAIQENIIEQITRPVNWTDSIRYLLAKGVDMDDFVEVGAGGLSIVRALAMRTAYEADPLDLSGEETDIKQEEIKTPAAETKKREKEKIKKKEKQKGKLKKKKLDIKFPGITAESLGSEEFKAEYNLKYAYAAGGMYKGIASKELVVVMAKAGMLGFFGTGGLGLEEVEGAIKEIQQELDNSQVYGMNLVSNPADLEGEEKLVDLFLQYGISMLEAAAYMQMTPALVRYRVKGLEGMSDGEIAINNKIMAKVSRPEVAEKFLSPAPARILEKLLEEGKINRQEADWAAKVPMADDMCVEADSAGHTDQGVAYAIMPAMIKLRDEMMEKYGYSKKIRLGAAGGIGTPEAAAAVFILGADFILTGSVNQCSVEAGTSEAVKDLLQQINVQDTDYAPAGDMFELGARVQVLKKGVFFPARANKLYELYRQFNSLEEIDEKTRKQIQERYFGRSFEEVYRDVKAFYPRQEIEKAERSPKHKMALIFKWYFGYGTYLALSGDEEGKVNYQVQCGPALGAFNQWVKGTALEDWRNRHVDEIAEKIMQQTAETLNNRFYSLLNR